MSSSVLADLADSVAPPAKRFLYGDPVHNEVMDFLVEEAYLLDGDELEAWEELLAEDLTYTMPTRQTMMRRDGRGFDPRMGHYDDTRATIRMRINRVLHTESAYAEDPPSRVRRLVTNVRVHEGLVEDELAVTSSLLLLRSRWDLSEYDLVSALRDDVLRRTPDGLKLARRRILMDQSSLGTPNLAVFF